ncbi:MAG: hypothetical protein ACOC33_02670 [bacterium]
MNKLEILRNINNSRDRSHHVTFDDTGEFLRKLSDLALDGYLIEKTRLNNKKNIVLSGYKINKSGKDAAESTYSTLEEYENSKNVGVVNSQTTNNINYNNNINGVVGNLHNESNIHTKKEHQKGNNLFVKILNFIIFNKKV